MFESPEHSVIQIDGFRGGSQLPRVKWRNPKRRAADYIPPESVYVRGGDKPIYDKSSEMWSIGVISYILLCGYPPFYGDNDFEIHISIRDAKFDIPSPEWDSISAEAKDFISNLLKKDPKSRPTAANSLDHPWFTEIQNK
ncbi:hypothetical protein TrLO_g8778 [Triparma laevis f. longispina]|uniref:Protein kinase domain-containing protein n=1 Tax=Triparma laevis f. longispina TaxID=1714387 RepID=A0A9W7AW38_9STRA|nr:hypothetical protein TrLO_g8778 [Triparma laevis f. longispina]